MTQRRIPETEPESSLSGPDMLEPVGVNKVKYYYGPWGGETGTVSAGGTIDYRVMLYDTTIGPRYSGNNTPLTQLQYTVSPSGVSGIPKTFADLYARSPTQDTTVVFDVDAYFNSVGALNNKAEPLTVDHSATVWFPTGTDRSIEVAPWNFTFSHIQNGPNGIQTNSYQVMSGRMSTSPTVEWSLRTPGGGNPTASWDQYWLYFDLRYHYLTATTIQNY